MGDVQMVTGHFLCVYFALATCFGMTSDSCQYM